VKPAAPPRRWRRPEPTLTRRLLVWALGALLVVWLSFVAQAYSTGIEEADELTDGHLASVASVLLSLRSIEFVAPGNPALKVNRPDLKNHDYQQSLSVVLWDAEGRLIGSSGDAPPPVFDATEGFADLRLVSPPACGAAFPTGTATVSAR